MCERKKERKRQKEKRQKERKNNNEQTNERTDERTYERKYAGSTFKRKLFCCLSKHCAKVLVIVVFKKSRGDSKRELSIKFNSPYFIANVSLTLVHAHVYERYIKYCENNVLSSNLQTCTVMFCCRPGSSYFGLVDESDA